MINYIVLAQHPLLQSNFVLGEKQFLKFGLCKEHTDFFSEFFHGLTFELNIVATYYGILFQK